MIRTSEPGGFALLRDPNMRRHRSFRQILGLASVTTLLAASAGCDGLSTVHAQDKAKAGPPVAKVEVVRPERRTVRRTTEQPGMVAADEVTPIHPKVSGHRREERAESGPSAVFGAKGRLRPILMTGCAMIAGMIPLALGWGEGAEQSAPLGRAVIGGLAAATLSTLFVLPSVFAIVQGRAGRGSASIDPFDPESDHYHPEALAAANGNGAASEHVHGRAVLSGGHGPSSSS